jgi:hypothetical protein
MKILVIIIVVCWFSPLSSRLIAFPVMRHHTGRSGGDFTSALREPLFLRHRRAAICRERWLTGRLLLGLTLLGRHRERSLFHLSRPRVSVALVVDTLTLLTPESVSPVIAVGQGSATGQHQQR